MISLSAGNQRLTNKTETDSKKLRKNSRRVKIFRATVAKLGNCFETEQKFFDDDAIIDISDYKRTGFDRTLFYHMKPFHHLSMLSICHFPLLKKAKQSRPCI